MTLTRKMVLDAITVTDGGENYTSATVTVDGTTAAAVIEAGVITSILFAPVDGYDAAPDVTITGDGTGAEATASVVDSQMNTLRKLYIQDFYAAGPPPVYVSPYNLVQKKNFFTDETLQSFVDQVLLEEPKLLDSYVTYDGDFLPPRSFSPTVALYRLVRIKCWSFMLTNPDYLRSMHTGASSMDMVETTIKQMERQMKQDRQYATNSGNTPSSFSIERF
jgi:hypothetical protein